MKSPQPTSRTLIALLSGLLLANQASAATTLWSGAGANDNWSTGLNWSGGSPNPGDTAVFGAGDTTNSATAVNNVVSSTATVSALSYTNVASGTWHVTQIPTGVTLSVTNLTVGFSGAVNGLVTSAAMVDAGTLTVYSNLTVGNNGSTSLNNNTILDLSGLSNFVYIANAGTLQLASGNRSGADMKLAAISNNITVGTMSLNTVSISSASSGRQFTLGSGTNIINVGAFNMGAGRGGCSMLFPASSGGTLRLRGVAGTDTSLANMTLGDHNNSGGGGSTATGNLSLNGNLVDMKLGTLIVGRNSNGTETGTGTGTSTVSFDTGTISATNILMAITTTPNTFSIANGTINVGASATLMVGTGGISLANQNGGTATGALNINGGTVICSNSITKANAASAGSITLAGGALNMASGSIGSAAVPITTLSMGDAALTLAVAQGATNAFVATLTVTSTTNNTINISSLPIILGYPAQFPLISYGSANPDFQLGTLPAGSPAFSGYISNNVANSTIDLVLTNGPGATIRSLTWNGNVNGNWNTNTLNWKDSSLVSTFYSQGDLVTFDDSLAGTTNVNLAFSLTPNTLTVSNSLKSYTFSGVGSLDGAVGLTKDGTGALTLSNSGTNSFTGNVSILGGILKLGGSDDRIPTNSVVTLADDIGVKLDLNNQNQTIRSLNGGGSSGGDVALGSGKLTDWGGGSFAGVISGTGQLIKTNFPGIDGGTLTLSNANTYSGGTIIGGTTNNTTLVVANPAGSGTGSGFVRVLTNGSLYLGNGNEGGSVASGVITNDGTLRINRTDDITFTNIIVGSGVLQIQNTNTIVIPGANAYTGGTTINPGNVRISNPNALGTGTIIIGNGNPAALQLTNGITLTNSLTIQSKPSASGVVPHIDNLSGNNTLSGPMLLTQNGTIGWVFSATADHLTISGPMLPVLPSQTSQNTTRVLWLRGDAIGDWNSGIIDTVNSVTNVNLRKDGLGTWTLSGANTYSGATVVSNGTLIVNGSITGSTNVTIAGGTLGGTGLISSPVTIGAAGTLAPGTSIGTLTITNSLTLGGTTVMEVSHSAGDRVAGIGNLSLGGTLTIVTNGTLTGGEVFQLFSATNYSGDFSSYDLPVLPDPLGWDASLVPVTGTLSVTGAVAVPTAIPLNVARTNNVLTFSWTNVLFRLQSQTNTLSLGLKTNWFDYPGGGSSPVNVTIDATKPTVFFRLVTP